MMLFAKLRESVALFICPELRNLKVLWEEDEAGYQEFAGSAVVVEAAFGDRPGYDGTSKPLERAALDAAYAERTPAERGFFSANEARAHARTRREWLAAEKSRLDLLTSEAAKALVVDSCHVIKARYPAVQDIGKVAMPAVSELSGHIPDALQEEHLGSSVMAERKCGGEQPHLRQQGEAHFDGINAGWDAAVLGHHSSPSVDVPCDPSPISASTD